MTVKCPKCWSENSTSSMYCAACGALLHPDKGKISRFTTRTRKLPDEELETGTVFARRYQVIEKLGEGGMGKVYKVLDREIDTVVVLKLIKHKIAEDRESIERFRNELRLAREISHKHVCRMFDLNKEGGSTYITMEYVPGEDLKSMIRMTKRMSIETAIDIARQVCQGLAEAHRLGIVHRDLKSANIVIDKAGDARIMDFGLARSLKSKGITGAGLIVGTPEYMSPEQVDGREADHRSDIYSLGVILYEMLTGRLPFEGETRLSIALKHKTEAPPDPRDINSQVSSDLSQVILKCMEKEREKRFQSAGELFSELGRIEENLVLDEKEAERIKPGKEKAVGIRVKRAILYGAMAVILIFLIAAGFYFIASRRKSLDSIAVLPFEYVNADSDTEYLGDGITETIISKLTQLPSLKKVIARSSVFRYKGKEIDPKMVGQELGVDAILVSRMSRRGDELSISVELVSTANNIRIWGNRYRRVVSDIFAIQEEITNSITENLRLSLTGEERQRITKRYTENAEAFVAFSKGQFFWNKRTEEDLQRAIEYFEQALQIDPNYALAYTGLAHSYLLLPEYGTLSPREAYPKSKEAALRALAIDPLLAEAHVSLAQIKRRYDYDWESAEREYKRAIELDPGYATAHHWYGYDLMCKARYEEAITEIRRAHELDPLSLVINRNLGQVYYRAGQFNEGLEFLQKTLEMDPEFSYTHFHLGSIYFQKSMYEEALAEFLKEKEISKGWSSRIEAWIGIVYLRMGEKGKGLEILDELMKKSEQIYVSQTLVAALYFELGEDDQGFQYLEKAYEDYDSWLRFIKTDPVFDRVRSDSRFTELIHRIGLN